MGVTVFSLPQHRERTPVFGYSMSKEEVAQQVGYEGIKILEQEEALEAGGMFGNLVYGAVELQAPNRRKSDLKIGNAILEVTSTNIIVDTPLVRGIKNVRGTVKEYISAGDDAVNISGVLVSPKGKLNRPYAQMQLLNEFRQYAVELTVFNEMLTKLGILALVIKQIQWLPFQYINSQPFKITCVSDDIELYKIDGKNILDA